MDKNRIYSSNLYIVQYTANDLSFIYMANKITTSVIIKYVGVSMFDYFTIEIVVYVCVILMFDDLNI